MVHFAIGFAEGVALTVIFRVLWAPIEKKCGVILTGVLTAALSLPVLLCGTWLSAAVVIATKGASAGSVWLGAVGLVLGAAASLAYARVVRRRA